MKLLRIGIIGTGKRAKFVLPIHQPEKNISIVGIADPNPQSLEAYRQQLNTPIFVTQNTNQLLERPDINTVFITSPDYLHEEHSIAALKAGKSVYLEKPMAISIESCDRILKTAFETKQKLYLGHNMRHFTVIQKMRELILKGAIGEVKTAWCRHFVGRGGDFYFKDWHAERSKSTGLLLQKGAHDIDILHWLCGGYTKRVTAMGNLSVYNLIQNRQANNPLPKENTKTWPPLSLTGLNSIIDVEDLSMMLMELENGVLASYQQCHYTPDYWRNYTIIGTEGRIENFGDMPGRAVVKVWNKFKDYNSEGDEQYSFPEEKGEHGGGDTKILGEFIRYLQSDEKVSVSAIAARYSVAAGIKATESLRNGSTPLEIPSVEQDLLEYFDRDVLK